MFVEKMNFPPRLSSYFTLHVVKNGKGMIKIIYMMNENVDTN